jgi:peroxiredoxin
MKTVKSAAAEDEMPTVKPRQPAPALDVATADGDRWRLADAAPEKFTMVLFYRGYHCPICKVQLREIDRRLDELAGRGIDVIAVSGDDEERGRKTPEEWGLERLRIGYGQTVESMRDWGLFVSHSIKESEPATFGEPGMFLVRPDGTVYWELISSMPFARPRLDDLLLAIDRAAEKKYPARGEA